jgi:phage-related protein
MIKFGTRNLEDVAPVKIDDIVVSPIPLNPVYRQRSIKWGANFVRMGGGVRSVAISFALLDSDIDNREALLQDIRDWCKPGAEDNLYLPMFTNRHLECACTQMPEHSYRKWWENKLRIMFTCFENPYWTSDELIEVPCGTAFSIGGSAPPLVTIERSGVTALTNQTYASRTESMTFSTIPAGSMVIDLNKQTAAIGNTSIMQYYKPSSTWIEAKVGANQRITGTGIIKYRERWL